jgi:hypothetical protein
LRIKVSTVTAYPSGWLKERALDVAAAVAVSLNKQKLKKKKKKPHPLSQMKATYVINRLIKGLHVV